MKKWIKMILVMVSLLLLMPTSILADFDEVQRVEEAFESLPTAMVYKEAKDAFLKDNYQVGYIDSYQAYKQQINSILDAYLNLSDEEKMSLNEMTKNVLSLMLQINEIPLASEIDEAYQKTKDYSAFQYAIQQAKEKCNEIKDKYAQLKEEEQAKVANYYEVESYNLISEASAVEEILITPAQDDIYVFKHSSNNRFYRYSIFDGRPLFTLVDTTKYGSIQGKSWTPNGIYSTSQTANFMAVYCVDIDTYSKKGTYYKRVNLEESGYFDEEAAAHIRSIVMNSYPYVSIEKAREILDGLDGKVDGKITNRCFDKDNNCFTGETVEVSVNQIDENELISATQHAIWSYSNYFDSQKKALKMEAYRLHQVSESSARESTIYPTLGLDYEEKNYSSNSKDANVQEMSAVSQYLCDYLAPIYSGESATEKIQKQRIITNIKVEKTVAVKQKNDIYKVYLKISLQDKLGNLASGSENDNLQLTIYSYDQNNQLLEKGTVSSKIANQPEHWMSIDAISGGKIKVVCSGEQELPLGAYFYSAKPSGQEYDENEINPGRKEAQNFVGMAMGQTKVSAETELVYKEEAKSTSITLRKTGEQGEILKGAEFTLSLVQENEPALKIESKTVSSNGECTFENLVAGNHYEITETNPPLGYEAMAPLGFEVIEQKGDLAFIFNRDVTIKEDVLIIPNQKYTELKVIKEWKNDEYRLEYRPDFIEIELVKNNQPTGDVQQLNEENNWSYSWNKLSKNDSWSVQEKQVENYVLTVDKEGTVVTLTNTLTLDLRADLNIYKTDETGNALSGAEFSLYKIESDQNKLIETKSSSKEGYVSFTDLMLGDYFLVEKAPSGYKQMDDLYFSVVDNGVEASIQFKETQVLVDGILQIKNNKIPEKIELTVIKKWNCQGNKMPKYVYVQLYEGNKAVENQKIKLSEENGWSYTFKDLDKDKNWTVKEVDVPKNYVASVAIEDGKIIITNFYSKVNTGDVQPVLWLSVSAVSSCFLMGYLYFRKIKHQKGE